MTKKLIWRLKEQPTSENLRELVKDGILSKEEAREVLFSLEENTGRDKKSLEDEIKFLRDIIDGLSKNNYSGTITIIKEIEKPYRQYPWYNPYITWCSRAFDTTSAIMYSTSSGSGITTCTNGASFNGIQTF